MVWLCVAVLLTGCQAQNSVQAAQTAIVVGQQAFATVQPYAFMLQGALAGADVKVTLTPDGALPQDVTDVTIQATDAHGSLAQVDSNAREAAATAALLAASQYFPKATIEVNVLDAQGATLVSGSTAPGQSPTVQ